MDEQRGPAARQPAIIFDFDGTLVDTFVFSMDLLCALAARPTLPADVLRRIRGMTTGQILRQLRISRLQALLLWWRANHRIRQRADAIKLVPGVAGLVRQLAAKRSLYIVSANEVGTVLTVLRRAQLTDCFVAVRGAAGPFHKARSLRRLVYRYHLDPKQTWYVGDQASDVRAARQVGMAAAAVTWGFNDEALLATAQPDVLAHTVQELARSLEKDGGTHV